MFFLLPFFFFISAGNKERTSTRLDRASDGEFIFGAAHATRVLSIVCFLLLLLPVVVVDVYGLYSKT